MRAPELEGVRVSTYLYRLARLAFRRRRVVLGIWLVAVVVAVLAATLSGGKTNDDFTIPGTEAQNASNLLTRKLPALAGGQMQVVFGAHGSATVTDPAAHTAILQTMANLKSVGQVASVIDPYTAKLVSASGQVALGTVQFSPVPAKVKSQTLDNVESAVRPAEAAGLSVDYGGSVYPGWNTRVSELPELVGLIVAFIILMITFGAFAAAGMPILNAIIGVVVTLMGITALASVLTIASASTTVALMLGLSCGIDYGLFILSRHRNNLLQAMTPEESIALAAGTAGSSVVFAALTVIIALCGLTVVGIPFLSVMGLAAAGSVLIALLVALTLLPALLGFAGEKVTHFVRLPWNREHFANVARTAASSPERTWGARWAHFVVRFRIPVLIGSIALLLVLAIPALSLELGLPSGASQPTSNTARRAYDLTSAGFGPGFNGPLIVIADPIASAQAAAPIATALSKEPNVLTASIVAAENGVAVIRVIPKTGPNDEATAHLVHQIRSDRSSIEGQSGARILVGGTTASNIDVSSKLSAAVPTFLVVVVGLAFVLLTFAFRTILVPIKSIIGFLLSMSAAFGSEVAMFQWGWGERILGVTKTETISFLPIIMLAIIFGLSSDYEVFVVSRIKEDFTRHGDARAAVERGTGLAARVVTAAALIMFFIFVAFMVTNNPTIKAIGFGFAIGVFLDAFVVRLTLVPAIMSIVRSKLWYHPNWFAKYVPDPDIEGARLERELESAAP